ncbi:hypothetical protein BSKO_01754 [Bryopsis sp. KO-2023]|nr:hypothetical protein BSKO_01754 [Bryopsis sp. KO-2023]
MGVPFLWTTLIFFAAGVIGTIVGHISSPRELKSLTTLLVITGVTCCWMLWAIFYLGQMNPLVLPELKAEGEAETAE